MKIWGTEHVFRLVTLDLTDRKGSPFQLIKRNHLTACFIISLHFYLVIFVE